MLTAGPLVAPWKPFGLETGETSRLQTAWCGCESKSGFKTEIPETTVARLQRSIDPWAELPKVENVMLTRLLAIAFVLTIAMPAFAQDQARARMLRTGATVEELDGQKLTVKTNAGETLSLTLPAGMNVVRSRPATVADVKAGQFIGCTAVEGPDGKLRARRSTSCLNRCAGSAKATILGVILRKPP